jgi:hypothetical protein
VKILDFRVRLRVKQWLDAWLPPHGPIPPFQRYIEVFGLEDRLNEMSTDPHLHCSSVVAWRGVAEPI